MFDIDLFIIDFKLVMILQGFDLKNWVGVEKRNH
jgi:hypothetical protein